MGKTEKSSEDPTLSKRSREKTVSGRRLVEKVCKQIQKGKIFPLFEISLLERVAFFESKYGLEEGGTKSSSEGGIWRVRKELFWDTQQIKFHPQLAEYFSRIYKAFGINWSKVEWEHVKQPLYSALAAGLLMSICSCGVLPRSGHVSDLLEEQAQFWKKCYYSSERRYYNQRELINDFISQVTHNGMSTCNYYANYE